MSMCLCEVELKGKEYLRIREATVQHNFLFPIFETKKLVFCLYEGVEPGS